MMTAPVRKAVFPVAGLGTRFLPATKSVPKEMLTVVDRPVLQYAVDEAREAGITHFIFVTGRNKAVIEDYFDIQPELETTLRDRGKTAALAELDDTLPEAGTFSFTRQQAPLGLGHAIWCARDLVGNEPFAVLLPDMLLQGSPGCLKSMIEVYGRTGGNVIAVGECDPKHVGQYGIVGVGAAEGDAFRVTSMVEKPKPGEAPSNRYINGRYIFQPDIFRHLSSHTRGAGGEIQVTDAMIALTNEQPFYGWTWPGRTYDCGSKAGYFAATFAYAIARDDLLPALAAEIDAHASLRQDGAVVHMAVDPALQGLRDIVQRRLNTANDGAGRRKGGAA